MKLHAKPIGYSSIVGGGLTLLDDAGRARFIVSFIGTTNGITKAETQALSEFFAEAVAERTLDVPARKGEKT